MTTKPDAAARKAHYRQGGAVEARAEGKSCGFVRFEEPGQFVDGRIVEVWSSEESLIANLRVDECSAPVYRRDKPVSIAPGDLVSVGLGAADLKGRITQANTGQDVLIVFDEEIAIKGGKTMKLYSVLLKGTPSAPPPDDGGDLDEDDAPPY